MNRTDISISTSIRKWKNFHFIMLMLMLMSYNCKCEPVSHKHKVYACSFSVSGKKQKSPSIELTNMAAALEERLSEAVRKYPCLYDKKSADFKNKDIKQRCWNDVAKEAEISDGKICICKLTR